MATFSPTQEPDEGYSEHPLNTSISGGIQDPAAALALRSSAELPAWLAAQMPKLTVQEKKHLAMLILNELPTTAIADIVMTQLNPRLYINFAHYLPPEICLKVLGYLDAASLIRVALCCRGWYELASDRKLWEKLYYLEGWMAILPEISLAEQRMNEKPGPPYLHLQSIESAENGHITKKRAISDPAPADEVEADDDDYQMVDADMAVADEHPDTQMAGVSLFGGPPREGSGSSQRSSNARGTGQLRKSPSPIQSSTDGSGSRLDKGKGKGKGKGKATSQASATNSPSTLPESALWMYDWRDQRFKISWKYLYSMRRKLESNWERGRYTNFQLPHPDHPEEGHNECIYSLQYNSEYLVSGSRDRTLRIWNLHSRRLIRPPLTGHSGSVLCLQFDSDPQEDLIVSGSSDSDVILWRFSTGEILQRLKKAHRESVLNVKFDKRILVTCSKDKTIKIFNRQPLRPGDLGYSDPQAVSPVPINLRNYGYDDSPLNRMTITPPYTMIACLDGHGAAVNAVQICDREIVSASGDRNIRLWDWPNQVVKRTFIGHNKGIACVQYDGRRIVSGSSDNEVKVFDCESGLEVASLRAHTNLVRTVQAGFGDLPYSREEDQLEARAIDQAYFDAVNTGSLEEARPGQRRAYNPGSRRPEDITAYGAKLPPGGGGGPYGRIVSGSYDQSIIIWRRDREGAWKSVHTLRQEEGAAAALRQTSGTSASAAPRRPSPAVVDATHPSGHRPSSQPTHTSPFPRPQPSYTQVDHPIHATITPQTTASYTQMIDAAVPQGPAALMAALASFPTMLTYNSHIQAAIDREPGAMARSQLRQVVSTSLVRAQMAQNRIRESMHQALAAEAGSSHITPASSYAAPPRPSHPVGLSHLLNGDPAEPPTMPGASTSGGPPPTMIPGTHAHPHPHQTLPQSSASQPFTTPTQHHGSSQAIPTATHHESRDQGHAQPPPSPPVQAPTLAHPQAPGEPQSHPHIVPVDASPARIFKLQFDARRIICCSQVSTIVGWDFCNGDAELEEVSKFFGTVE